MMNRAFRNFGGPVQSYDLVVIGSGPAGEKAAAQAAYFGKRVALVESEAEPGGACVNSGTIPSKILRESALYFSGLKQRGLYGIDYSLREGLTVEGFTHRKNVLVEIERQEIKKNLAAHHVDVFWGTGSFEDPHTIAVASPKNSPERLRGDVILIATGSRPHRPPEIPFDDKSHLRFRLDPANGPPAARALIVVGGGVIGCEYASIFTALGVKVSLVDGRDRLLPFLDAELSRAFARTPGGARRRVPSRRARRQDRARRERRAPAAQVRKDSRGRCGSVRRGPARHGRRSRPRESRPRAESARLHRRERVVSDFDSAHLRRRRRHRLPRPRVNLDGAGPRRRLPRLRI